MMPGYHETTIEDAFSTIASGIAQLVRALVNQSASKNKAITSEQIHHKVRTSKDCDVWSTGALQNEPGDENAADRCRLYVYLAGCGGLKTLARACGPRVMSALELEKMPYLVKCGTTTLNLPTRLKQIAQDRYGAAIRSDEGIEIEPGFAAWIAHAITTSRRPRDPAVTLLPRALAVDLPSGLTRRAFDMSLHRALKTRALDRVPTAVMPKRFVAYDLVEMRVSAAKEFYALSPHDPADGDLLLGAIEGILERFRVTRS